MSASAGDLIVVTSGLTSRDRLLQPGPGRLAVEATAQLQALLDACRVLRHAGVDHALIGGIAVAVRSGVPRATQDVDLAVRSDAGLGALVGILSAAGFTHRGSHRHSVNFRHENTEPVQLAFDPDFDAMIERAEEVEVAGEVVPVVTLEDLIAMKERAARAEGRRPSKALRDLADLALLRGDVPAEDEGW